MRPLRGNRPLSSQCLLLCGFALIAMLFIANSARATCSQFLPPPEFYVGDTDSGSPTYDAACTHATIQDAINAATCIYGTKIFITHEHAWTNQHLTVDNKNVTLIGRKVGDVCGPASAIICNPTCPPPITDPLVSIGGQNGSGVFSITGTSNVTLRYLDINNGNNSANGGGVGYLGSGSLTLDTTWVRANQAVVGGGVYFVGTGATASPLTVQSYTQILANTASDEGGGIYVGGTATLNMIGMHIAVDGNTAATLGGGIAVIGPANANIGAPDDNGQAAIRNNHAEYGGGIAITAIDNNYDSPLVKVFTIDPSQPTSIYNNTASHTGGGVWLKSVLGITLGTSYADFCAWDYRIEANQAQEGAAIYADSDSSVLYGPAGSAAYLGECFDNGYPSSIGAVPCSHNASCNTVNGNIASDSSGNPTSTILIQTKGELYANHFSMRGNVGAHVIRAVGDGESTFINLSECLIAQNQAEQELIYIGGNMTPLSIDSCTLADDATLASFVIHAESNLTLTDSIIDEPDTLTIDYSGDPANRVITYVLSNDISTAPGAILGTPKFVDAASGDFHLQPNSIGIEYAPATDPADPSATDLEGNPRIVDLPLGDVYGPRDLGPYERQNLFQCGTQDSVFCNGYER